MDGETMPPGECVTRAGLKHQFSTPVITDETSRAWKAVGAWVGRGGIWAVRPWGVGVCGMSFACFVIQV